MKTILSIIGLTFCTLLQLYAQELDCEVTVNTQQLSAEARENLVDFAPQIKQYINSQRWTKEDFGNEKIKCNIDIMFQATPKDNRYVAQAFIGSVRAIRNEDRNTAVVRLLDDKWEFDYFRFQPLSRNEYRIDPLLSFIDFYVYLILGFDFDTYGLEDGTPYFQKAMEIVNKARANSDAGKGWDISPQTTYQRGQLVDELLNPKFRELREAVYRYHSKGLDLLYKDPTKGRKNILATIEKIGKTLEKINQWSLAAKVFFDTKYLEIAEIFSKDSDKTIYSRLSKIDPTHQKTYEEYAHENK